MRLVIDKGGNLIMDKNTAELLRECSSGCHMAIGSMEQVIGAVSDQRLKDVIDEYNVKHKELKKRSDALLRGAGEHSKSPSSASSAFAWFSTEMKMMIDDSSHQIASVMTDGCNMGIKTICEYLNRYEDASDESRRIACDIVSAEESFMRDLRHFI